MLGAGCWVLVLVLVLGAALSTELVPECGNPARLAPPPAAMCH